MIVFLLLVAVSQDTAREVDAVVIEHNVTSKTEQSWFNGFQVKVTRKNQCVLFEKYNASVRQILIPKSEWTTYLWLRDSGSHSYFWVGGGTLIVKVPKAFVFHRDTVGETLLERARRLYPAIYGLDSD